MGYHWQQLNLFLLFHRNCCVYLNSYLIISEAHLLERSCRFLLYHIARSVYQLTICQGAMKASPLHPVLIVAILAGASGQVVSYHPPNFARNYSINYNGSWVSLLSPRWCVSRVSFVLLSCLFDGLVCVTLLLDALSLLSLFEYAVAISTKPCLVLLTSGGHRILTHYLRPRFSWTCMSEAWPGEVALCSLVLVPGGVCAHYAVVVCGRVERLSVYGLLHCDQLCLHSLWHGFISEGSDYRKDTACLPN